LRSAQQPGAGPRLGLPLKAAAVPDDPQRVAGGVRRPRRERPAVVRPAAAPARHVTGERAPAARHVAGVVYGLRRACRGRRRHPHATLVDTARPARLARAAAAAAAVPGHAMSGKHASGWTCCRPRGVEGLVVKGAASRYQPGRREWLKVNSVGAVSARLIARRSGMSGADSCRVVCARHVSCMAEASLGRTDAGRPVRRSWGRPDRRGRTSEHGCQAGYRTPSGWPAVAAREGLAALRRNSCAAAMVSAVNQARARRSEPFSSRLVVSPPSR